MAEIRHATPADIPALMEMGRALHAESPRYQGMPFNDAKVAAMLEQMMASDAACVLLAESGGQAVGVTLGAVAERWFNDERFITDRTVYVKPAHRGGSAFPRMVKELERWAAACGIADITVGVSTEINPEKTVHTYRKLGYRLSGYAVTKTLDLYVP